MLIAPSVYVRCSVHLITIAGVQLPTQLYTTLLRRGLPFRQDAAGRLDALAHADAGLEVDLAGGARVAHPARTQRERGDLGTLGVGGKFVAVHPIEDVLPAGKSLAP